MRKPFILAKSDLLTLCGTGLSDHKAPEKKAPDQAPLESHLCHAARDQDMKTLERWLRRAKRLRNRRLSIHAIHRAAANGNEDMINILIRFGCNLELKRNGYASLSLAIWSGREGATELLARTKIAVNELDPEKLNSPLHFVAQRSFPAGLKSLLKAGASVYIRNHIQATPLHVAASNGDSVGLKLLREHGATVSFRDKNGRSAFQKLRHLGPIKSFAYCLTTALK